MKIVVCVKRVPDTTTKVQVGGDGKSIDPAGVKYVMNPYDEIPVTKAIEIKESVGGDSEVVILSLGSADAATEVRTALAMGADRGILLETSEGNWDSHAVSLRLAEALRDEAPDLVFFGKQAVDDDDMQVGGRVAELLDMPGAHLVGSMEVDGSTLRMTREVEGGTETLECSLPAAIVAQKSLAEPKYPSLKGIMAAKRKPIDQRAVEHPGAGIEVLAMELPPARPDGRIVGEGVAAVDELVELLRNEAKVI